MHTGADAPLPPCPLCDAHGVRPFAHAHGRHFHECGVCGLVFVNPAQRPGEEAERAHYGTHRNDPQDAGYRAFLNRAAAPLVARLAPGAEGLDYGSGPGPTLAVMLREQGFGVTLYDPFFAPDPSALRRRYHFITCTETAEHFHHPGEEFRRLDEMLRPGGWLVVMTELLREERPLERWRYARDPTHVCFYGRETLGWIGARHGWRIDFPHPDVALFHKAAG